MLGIELVRDFQIIKPDPKKPETREFYKTRPQTRSV